MQKPRLWIFACLLSIASGCAGATSRPTPPSNDDPGTVVIAFQNDLRWPYTLSGLSVVLDGSPVYISRGGLQPPRDLGKLPVVEGNHVLDVQVSASYPSGSVGEDCRLKLRDSRVFAVEKGAASSILLDLRTGRLTEDFAKRVKLDVHLSGTSPVRFEEIASGIAVSGDCDRGGPRQQKLCQARARISEAREARDLIALDCALRSHASLEASSRRIERVLDALEAEPAPAPEVAESLRAEKALLQRDFDRGWEDLEGCPAIRPNRLPDPSRSVVELEGCRGDEPLDDFEE